MIEKFADIATSELEFELLESFSMDQVAGMPDAGDTDLRKYLNFLLEKKGLVRRDVVATAQINDTYGWELFCVGKKKPSRNKLLALAFALQLSPSEAKKLLYLGKASALYAKDRRDAIILLALHHRLTLAECDVFLYEHKLETICESK